MEYAPQFSKQEARRRIFLTILVAGFLVLVHLKWLQPLIVFYIETAHCHTPFGYSGFYVLWVGMFVGIPLFFALSISPWALSLGIKGLIHGQFPPKGMKVYKPTKILRGGLGMAKSIALIFFPFIFLMMAVWGSTQVDSMPKASEQKLDYQLCDLIEELPLREQLEIVHATKQQ